MEDLSKIYFWFQTEVSSLSVAVVLITLMCLYYFFIERNRGIHLSKKYRNSLYEVQSKLFLNATQYLISGNKDLAIKEFLNAVDLNRETLDTYFALGRLFRSNGEIEKSISIHRSLIARENISEATRLSALKELALDFDKGGFKDKAIDTYKDALKLNKDQPDVIKSLCRIYEDVADWDSALNFRLMLSKVSRENQAETLSHIIVEQAKVLFEKGDFNGCRDKLEDALRFAPSVSAKILQLKIFLIIGKMEDAKIALIEMLKEHPMFASFLFLSLEEVPKDEKIAKDYLDRLNVLKEYFLQLKEVDFNHSAAVFLSRIRVLTTHQKLAEALNSFKEWLATHPIQGDVMRMEYIKILILLGSNDEALNQTKILLGQIQGSSTRHYCSQCGFNSDDIFWRCPQCYEWETIQFRWKI